MVFKPLQKGQKLDVPFKISDHCINRVKETVFLVDVVIDENLTRSRKPHTLNVLRKNFKINRYYYTSDSL